ncbi:MAG: gliding motility-associated C-terminal domain-containing protein [Chitinophagales bacterium]|nr:gliding motility-associated C-terminal domain-containing protein [Chitinophagaceae bacterium]MCB9064035.1 gliding motility-associated C-terminal domain-containing protein [Chitinophagales bacterium]
MFIVSPCSAQSPNLVPNPSFEQYNNCPTSLSGVSYSPGYTNFPTVQGWVSPLKNGSPDYFNTCASSSSYVHVPQNAFGNQSPRNGNGYIGIIAWQGELQGGNMKTLWSEYLQCKLLQPLAVGERYCVTFFVNSAIANATFNFVGINKIGINFSGNQQTDVAAFSMNLPYSIYNNGGNFLTDTTGWTKITGIYTATGGEEWLTLGWFDNGSAPTFQPIVPVIPNPADNYRNYVYIDDISVVKIDNKDTFTSYKEITYCNKNQLPIQANSAADLGEYKWNNGETGKQIQIKDSGTYWCISQASCKVFVDTYVIKYHPAPELNLGNELVNCDNQPIEIDPGYPGATSYTWNTGANTEKITVNTSGIYILTVNDVCGTQTDTVHVYIQPPTPEPIAVDTTICQFSMNPTIMVQGSNINWYTHSLGHIGVNFQPPIITREPGSYSLYITQTIGKCESEKVPVNISITYTPHETLGDKVVMCENDIKMIGEFREGVDYKWNTGSNSCCILPDREGLYKLAMHNDCGSYIDSITVYHTSCDDCIVFPNAFSPLSGTENSVFKPIVKCPVDEFHMKVYNRWGNLLFESKDINIGWTGRDNYYWADLGTYMYVVEYRAKDKKQVQRIYGNVTLVR